MSGCRSKSSISILKMDNTPVLTAGARCLGGISYLRRTYRRQAQKCQGPWAGATREDRAYRGGMRRRAAQPSWAALFKTEPGGLTGLLGASCVRGTGAGRHVKQIIPHAVLEIRPL